MSVRTKVLGVSCLAVLVAMLSGLLSFIGVQELGGSVGKVARSGSALRVHMEIDRLRESLTVDVLNAVRIGRMVREARDKVIPVAQGHQEALSAALGEVAEMELPPDVKSAADEIYPQVATYADEAVKLAELGFVDNYKAAQGLDAFAQQAGALQAAMREITDLFQAHTSATEASAAELSGQLGYFVIGAALVTFFVLVVSVALVSKLLLRPLHRMTDVVTRISQGDLSIEVPEQERLDEIGQIASAVQIFKENAAKTEALAAERAASVARRAKRAQLIEELCAHFDAAISEILKGVGRLMSELQEMAHSMARNAEQTEAEANEVGLASNEANRNVNSVAAAAEQLAASVTEVSQQTAHSSEIAARAASQAQNTNQQIQGLSKAAQKVGEVVSLITEIANQTNLLALNATIEAARAGDAGKGFAVVASEVKHLATQTAHATDEISHQIDAIQMETKQAVAAIELISKTILEINGIAGSVASAVEEQSATTREIARSAENAAQGTAAVATSMASVSGQASQTGTAAARILAAVSDLAQRSSLMQQKVDGFMRDIKSA